MRRSADVPASPALSRRRLLASAGAFGALSLTGGAFAQAPAGTPLLRAIPSTAEQIPAIGMGTWITFNVGGDMKLRQQRLEVMQTFFQRGGRLIDSSPMYGSSEEVVGWCMSKWQGAAPPLFSATKVWTMFQSWGVSQMEKSEKLWGTKRFDLLQIHNLLDWENHLETLKEWKANGRVRYIGITTSHGRRHRDLEKILATEPFDFVQFTYNLADREVEERLLPLAAERKIAVIINRPFQGGSLFDAVEGKPLPDWAREFDAANWAQFFLKFVVSHPAVTCAIPATSQVAHMNENMGALAGRLPDPGMRQRMIRHFAEIS